MVMIENNKYFNLYFQTLEHIWRILNVMNVMLKNNNTCDVRMIKIILERYKEATIRKRHNQKKIPTPKTGAGKNQTNNNSVMTPRLSYSSAFYRL